MESSDHAHGNLSQEGEQLHAERAKTAAADAIAVSQLLFGETPDDEDEDENVCCGSWPPRTHAAPMMPSPRRCRADDGEAAAATATSAAARDRANRAAAASATSSTFSQLLCMQSLGEVGSLQETPLAVSTRARRTASPPPPPPPPPTLPPPPPTVSAAVLPRLKVAGAGLLRKLNRRVLVPIRNRVDQAMVVDAATAERPDQFIGFWDEHWGISVSNPAA